MAARAMGLDAHYIGKHTLFRKPYGWFFRSLGGIPVDRREAASLAQQLAERFDGSDAFILGLAPEGTRSKTNHWKSGFYHIAREAGVPIVMGWLDYPSRSVGMGGAFVPDDSLEQTFERVRAFYAPYRGRYPEKESQIRPRER